MSSSHKHLHESNPFRVIFIQISVEISRENYENRLIFTIFLFATSSTATKCFLTNQFMYSNSLGVDSSKILTLFPWSIEYICLYGLKR
jgi:hypothetical protein